MGIERILWVCNKKPEKVSRVLGQPIDCFGGWIDSACDSLLNRGFAELSIVYPDKTRIHGNQSKLFYYSFRTSDDNSGWFSSILEDFKPDVVHIWGTEFPHAWEFINQCVKKGLIDRCVVSIQGLVSVSGQWHYTEGLPNRIVNMFTLRDLIKRDNIALARKKFVKRGGMEEETIRTAKHVIGRTDWDRATVQMINQNAEYHFCNESLRDSFYHQNWNINKVERHTIFVSQCSYPIKGFHFLLQAMPMILRDYPDTIVLTTGIDLLHMTVKQLAKISSYQLYIRSLIWKYDLQDHVKFLGELTEGQMCAQYLRANVFVSPSTIENSPNSVGEAMLVGCPVVSSNVGGVMNMIDHGREGFVYQASAPYMLAYYVNKIFADDELAKTISSHAQERAKKTHDREENIKMLLQIYKLLGE